MRIQVDIKKPTTHYWCPTCFDDFERNPLTRVQMCPQCATMNIEGGWKVSHLLCPKCDSEIHDFECNPVVPEAHCGSCGFMWKP